MTELISFDYAIKYLLRDKGDYEIVEGFISAILQDAGYNSVKIKALLEDNFPFIWITGEISNFSSPMSGHYYFSLKDENAQISTVMFRGQNRNLKFRPKDGMAVTGLGRISLYKPRGTYQIIFEYLEPRGVGALQVAFEQLKSRLSSEGLFDDNRKKSLPFLPQKIALITSPTGAVLHDMINITRRRFKNMCLLVIPTKVQGVGAEKELVRAIDMVNRFSGADVAILARGGGSLEDLQAFNSEAVIRAIAGSSIPIVSAVGHETDYTISDFVADLRAPTPSAAAEMVVPRKDQLLSHLSELKSKSYRSVNSHLKDAVSEFKYLSERLEDPVKKIQDMKMKSDEMTDRLLHAFSAATARRKELLEWRVDRFSRAPVFNKLEQYSINIGQMDNTLKDSFRNRIGQAASIHNTLHEKLSALSPLSVLDRGYSITRTIPGKRVVRRQDQVEKQQHLEIILAKGGLEVSVEKKTDPEARFNRSLQEKGN